MRIVLATSGTWGDVQPVVLVAQALMTQGHDVLVAAPPEQQGRLAAWGVAGAPLGFDAQAFLTEHRALLTKPLSLARLSTTFTQRQAEVQVDQLVPLLRDADRLIASGVLLGGRIAAEKANVPYRYLALTPQILPAAVHPPVTVPWQHLPQWLNRMLWVVQTGGLRMAVGPTLNRMRRKHGLPARPNTWRGILTDTPVLASDPELVAAPDAGAITARQLGALTPTPTGALAPALDSFLTTARAPIYVGFGSMPDADEQALVRLVRQAAERARATVVMLAREAHEMSEHLHVITHAPHALLFPRMAGIVHHGGAGTVAAAARSGSPQAIVPYLLDQYYWAARVQARGVGVALPARRKLTVDVLARCFSRLLLDVGLREQAAALTAAIVQRERRSSPLTAVADALLQ